MQPKTPASSFPSSGKDPPRVVVVPTVIVPVVVPVFVPVPVSTETPRDVPVFPAPEDDEKKLPPSTFSRAPPSALSGFWRNFGGTGFVLSVLFHFALIIFALFWVISEWRVPEESVPMFVSGSGGRGVAGKQNLTKRAFQRTPDTLSPKIVSRKKSAQLVLPAMPKEHLKSVNVALARATSLGNGNDTLGSADLGGGGVGLGVGVGIGGGENHLGKFKVLLGAKIRAQRIAVYLDCSGSMTHFLPAVKAEIYEKFPNADVFAYAGTQTEIHDGVVVGGKSFRAKMIVALKRKPVRDETEVEKLSSIGKALYKKYAAHFSAGTAGAWLDVFSRERYDALIIFSDFRDGIRQRRNGKTVFADSSYSPKADSRTKQERKWEEDWLAAFSRTGAPKLYLFSVRASPQAFFEKCVSTSGGSTTILDLRKSK